MSFTHSLRLAEVLPKIEEKPRRTDLRALDAMTRHDRTDYERMRYAFEMGVAKAWPELELLDLEK